MTGGFFANGDLWDYDQLGISQDAVLVTGDIFPFPLTGSRKGPAVVMIPKDKVYRA